MTDNEITPGRQTLAYFDLTEQVTIEDAFSVTRAGSEIARDVALGLANDTPADDTARHSNVTHWGTGAISLTPLQHDISNLHEGVVCAPHIISVPSRMTLLGSLTGAALIVAENRNRRNDDLSGFSASSNIQPVGDPFLVKHIPAGAAWNGGLADGLPTPDFVTQDIPMDRVGYSNESFPADQGYFLRWEVPGHLSSVFSYTWAFYFGQYAICIKGTGQAELWEYCYTAAADPVEGAEGSMNWKRRTTWQYAKPGQVSATAHSMAVYPHTAPNGLRYISFTNSQLEAAVTVSQFTRTDNAQVAPGEKIYFVDDPTRSPLDQDMSPGHATAAAIVRYDVREDLKVAVQFSTLAYPTTGFLVDLPANLPEGSDPTVPVLVYANAAVPSTCGLITTLKDSETGGDYTPGTGAGPAARFDFTGDGTTTPILWEYRMSRDAVIQVVSPGLFTSSVNEVNVTGVSGDPSQDTAHVTIMDVKADIPRLRTRGQFSSAVVVQDALGKVVLHRGYAARPSAIKRGKAGRSYPSPDWRDFSVPMRGMELRMGQKYQGPVQRKFSSDPLAEPDAKGAYPPWKVTDVVRRLLLENGYAEGQVNIPDLDIRLWPGETVKADDYILDAAGNVSEYLLRLVRDYTGGYLIFDANAGAMDPNGLPFGQWTLLFQTPLPDSGQFAPLFNFVTLPPGGVVAAHSLASYPAGTAPIFGRVESTTTPPEFNHVFVCTSFSIAGTAVQGTVGAHAYNYQSYSAPGSGVTLDPTHPDYLGYEMKTIYPDMTLTGNSLEETQRACNFIAQRVMSFAGHAQVLKHYNAPLVFITDPIGGYRRPLRFQDPISINGDASWLVKGCHPHYAKDGFQLAEYEVVQPVPGQNVKPGVEIVSFSRHADAQHARQANGAGTSSQKYGRRAVPAHREHAMLEQPSLLGYSAPLQDPSTGAFLPMAGF